MPSGGNEIKFKFDPDAIADDKGFAGVIEPVADKEPQKPEPVKAPSQEPNPVQTPQAQEPPAEPVAKPAPVAEPPKEPELNDDQVLSYYNKQMGTNYESLDQIKQVEEVEKIVEKEKELPQHLKGYMKFYEETGRSLDDYSKLNKDYSKLSNMELARDAILKENAGINFTQSEIDILLAEMLEVEPEDLSTLEGREMVKLKAYANKHLQSIVAEQKKYKQPLETAKPKVEPVQSVGEMVTLTNGQKVPKADYEKQRAQYLAQRKSAVDSLENYKIELVVDNNGEKVSVPFTYDYTEEDRHGMLSNTEDVNAILPRYKTADGKFDHKSFNEDQWWSIKGNREKAITAMLDNAKSTGVDEVLKEKRNINFDPKSKPQATKKVPEGYANGQVGITPRNGGYGVKYGLPTAE